MYDRLKALAEIGSGISSLAFYVTGHDNKYKIACRLWEGCLSNLSKDNQERFVADLNAAIEVVKAKHLKENHSNIVSEIMNGVHSVELRKRVEEHAKADQEE